MKDPDLSSFKDIISDLISLHESDRQEPRLVPGSAGSRNGEGLWKVKRDHLAERLQEIVDRAAALHADQSTAIHKELGNRSDSGQED